MADSWEENDWEKEDFVPALPATKPAAEYETKGQALLAATTDVDLSKFADEDKEEPQPQAATTSKPAAKSAPKKDAKKEYKPSVDDTPLDDPVAEKLRQQRLIEEADYKATQELFGSAGRKPLDDFLPKSLKDYDDFAAAIAGGYVTPHWESKHFKAFVKQLIKYAVEPLPSNEIKDLEASLTSLRLEKAKTEAAEKEKAAAKKSGKKVNINMGKGSVSAGLDDYVYDGKGDYDDEYDFM